MFQFWPDFWKQFPHHFDFKKYEGIYTFRSSYFSQCVHIRSLPALHYWLAHNLKMCISIIKAGCCTPPSETVKIVIYTLLYTYELSKSDGSVVRVGKCIFVTFRQASIVHITRTSEYVIHLWRSLELFLSRGLFITGWIKYPYLNNSHDLHKWITNPLVLVIITTNLLLFLCHTTID